MKDERTGFRNNAVGPRRFLNGYSSPCETHPSDSKTEGKSLSGKDRRPRRGDQRLSWEFAEVAKITQQLEEQLQTVERWTEHRRQFRAMKINRLDSKEMLSKVMLRLCVFGGVSVFLYSLLILHSPKLI